MPDQRNIVILGSSFAGIQSAQYIIKYILPSLNAKSGVKHHLYVISPSPEFYYMPAAPRTSVSVSRLPVDKLFISLDAIFDKFPKGDFTFIQASASGLDTGSRTVLYRRGDKAAEEKLAYHALIIATGTNTHHPAFSSQDSEITKDAIKDMNSQVSSAKNIVVVGGGATGVETAAELGEHLNGKPGWFSTPPRKVNITLITASNQLIPQLRPAIGKSAEATLKNLGVEVRYNTRVTDTRQGDKGQTTLTLSKGEKIETDLYLPLHGVFPNSSYLPKELLNSSGYVVTNSATLRVDAAGPRVYALGDISSVSRNKIADLNDMLPVLHTNLKRDLYAFNPSNPFAPAPGKDREFKLMQKEMLGVTLGTSSGVGAVAGWRIPGFIISFLKGRDMMVGMVASALVDGSRLKESPWKGEEVVA
ncbi:FAD/NAD(P)-binding domain-containing protein [Periconia macrospinosa]|uniref:FAD/NAD(P)-binding domain-containing protein n=1 Tax=Periconia macrospinosa TaxID=97972 RepID=A0A2V1DK10_9PLEO|nr:FAD/NAD(P)-binding domain-containing protein [Periconia macrospinosa]